MSVLTATKILPSGSVGKTVFQREIPGLKQSVRLRHGESELAGLAAVHSRLGHLRLERPHFGLPVFGVGLALEVASSHTDVEVVFHLLTLGMSWLTGVFNEIKVVSSQMLDRSYHREILFQGRLEARFREWGDQVAVELKLAGPVGVGDAWALFTQREEMIDG